MRDAFRPVMVQHTQTQSEFLRAFGEHLQRAGVPRATIQAQQNAVRWFLKRTGRPPLETTPEMIERFLAEAAARGAKPKRVEALRAAIMAAVAAAREQAGAAREAEGIGALAGASAIG